MLDTIFSRPKGDIGNPETYSFPVAYQLVEKATIRRAVKMADPALVEPFIEKAKLLQNKGIKAITTSCGFLALYQKEIQSKLEVPFFSSSLMQIPMVSTLTGGTVGLITASKSNLTDKHYQGVNAQHTSIVIEGMDSMPAFTKAIIDETINLDTHAVALEMKQVTLKLIEKNPEMKAIILECTNMPPYRGAIRQVTDLPVFDINTMINYVVGSL